MTRLTKRPSASTPLDRTALSGDTSAPIIPASCDAAREGEAPVRLPLRLAVVVVWTGLAAGVVATPLLAASDAATGSPGAAPAPTPQDNAPPVAPGPVAVKDGIATISKPDIVWDPTVAMYRIDLSFPVGPKPAGPVMTGDSPAAIRLDTLYASGQAAGNFGDLYDDRDDGHSLMAAGLFPQMARTRYDDSARGFDRGLNASLLFGTPTIGNASLAITAGPFWRSLPRAALVDPKQVQALYQEYVSNQIYVYPEHRDHDPDHGDVYPANTPYYLISQGSSGSDRPILQAVAAILAAFRPQVKSFLVGHGLLAPTVQWIFRVSQDGVKTNSTYLSGKAHPTVFNGSSLNVLEMVNRANQLTVADVPPMVSIKVTEESEGGAAADTSLPATGDRLFDTPSAVARVIRSTSFQKRLVVDAGDTVDPGGQPLTFRWVVLNGKADIHLLDDSGSKAEIVVPWQERQPMIWQPSLTSDRVDIGVFASHGTYWSAPAFISLEFPGNERRSYRPDGQIAQIDYEDPALSKLYVDPLLFPARQWRDAFLYDASGNFIGWNRVQNHAISRFTRDGARATDVDARGRPVRAEVIRYKLARSPSGLPMVVEEPTGRIVTYRYSGAADTIGRRVGN